MTGNNWLIVALIIFLLLLLFTYFNSRSFFCPQDKEKALQVFQELAKKKVVDPHDIPYITDGDLEKNIDRVYAAMVVDSAGMSSQCPMYCSTYKVNTTDIDTDIPTPSCNIERFKYSPADNDYWLYSHYANQDDPSSTRFPPGLFSRLYYWYPGFNVNGYSFHLRPGIHRVTPWPKNRWVRNNDNYYYISNEPYLIPINPV